MPGENYNNYLNGKQLSDKKTTGNPKKSLSFLWGIPVGILLAIIFLLSYKFLHLKYSDDTQTVDIVSTMDSYDYSAQNEKILALKAEIDMFRNALENRKCQGEPFEEEDPEPILEIPSEDTLPLPLTENLIEDDILTANLDIEKIPVAIPDVVPKETPKVIPKEPAKVTPKEVPKATPKETPKVAPKEPSK
jgi:outer membrane biosynthesis protein TonB